MENLNTYYLPPESSGQWRWKRSRWLRLSMMVIMLFTVLPSVMAEAYITDMVVLGEYYESDINTVKSTYKNKGWTIVNKDLNSKAGGYYIYLAYKTAEDKNPQTAYITDVIAMHSDKSELTYNNRKYYKVPTNDGFNGNLNRGATGSDIFLYYTRDRTGLSGHYGTYRSISNITTSDSSGSQNGGSDDYGPICWAEDPWGACDANKNCGSASDYIYIRMHFRRQKLTVKSEPTVVSGLVYNGSDQNLVKAPSGSNWGTMYYKVNNGSWNKTATAKNVGTYTVTYHLEGGTFADDSDDATLSVEIKAPTVKANNLQGTFNQGNKNVNLTWGVNTIPGNYSNYKWVVYRGNVKLGTVAANADRKWTDTGFTNDSDVLYYVYYVSNTWDENTKNSSCQASVNVNTTRKVPVSNLKAVAEDTKIVLTWESDGYPAGWGNKFNIYVDDETTPIYTITPTNNQKSFRWEHRYTDKHSDRVNGMDGTTHFTEEQNLGACTPHSYRVEGVIGTKKLNEASVEKKSIGAGTAFYALEPTKGSYAGQVKVSWHVDNQGTTKSKVYIISRRIAERPNDAWDELARVESAEEYQVYTDETALPGVYYEYRVTVVEKCDNGNEVYTVAQDIGFAMAKGAVSGRVTYGASGSSVKDVEVTMEMASASSDEAQYYSMYFTSANGKVTWDYPSTTYATDKFASGDFSVQMWINPTVPANCWIARFKGTNVALGMSANKEILFTDGSKTYNFGLYLVKDVYSHVTLTRQGKVLTCYLITFDGDGNPEYNSATKEMGGNLNLSAATQYELGFFEGYVDEFRLWTKCLSEDDIKANYDRLIVGNEKGLETYWNFDEGLSTQFFDYSREGTVYHQHHGKMGGNAETATNTPAKLALKGKTDSDGNYVIQGVPFTGEGTNYNIKPILNSHEFSPQKLSRFFSSSSQVHNSVDFSDISSFEVSGKVLYAGSNIPVDSVQIYVDGRAVSRKGEPVQTNQDGKFVVDVPIGYHYLTAVRDGHTFVDGGRIPADPLGLNETAVEFISPREGLVFTDNTLVTVAGRVVGGAIEGEKPLGFGLSKNNIGKAVITLEIPNTDYMLNCYEEFDGNVFNGYQPVATNTDLTHPTDLAKPGEAYMTGGQHEGDAQRVVITTDAETGEFGVMLPPLDYKVLSVVMENDDAKAAYTFNSETLPRIDASYATTVQKDSVEENGTFRYFEYVASFEQTLHTQPVLDVKQTGMPDGVFGNPQVSYTDPTTNKTTNYDTYSQTGNTVNYTFGYPIFGELGKYTFNLEGYEMYTNYEKAETDTGRESKVPLKGMVVTISNGLSASQVVKDADAPNGTAGEVVDLKQNQLQLDENGKAVYKWQAGLPNIQSPYTRSLNMTYDNGAGQYSWNGPHEGHLDGIIFGDLPSGTNFTTKGPSEVEMILHDPYGDSSFATWETGTVTVESKDTLGTHVQDNGMMVNAHFGPDITTNAGVGITIENAIDVIADESIGFDRATQNDTVNTHTTTIELTRSISTSAEPDFIGADGDLYIGKSTNLLFGKARSVGLVKDENSGEIVVGDDDAITVGKKFATNFVYTEYHIINILIPNLMMVRNDLLTHVDNMATATNETNEAIYVTDLLSTDPNYGTKGTYKMIPPKGADGIVADKVGYYNDEIRSWESIIAQNEQYKLDVFESGKGKKNSSFGGGSEITETSTTEKSFSRTISYTHNYTLQWSFDGGATWNGLGADVETWNNTTWENAESSTNENSSSTSFSYTLADSGSDDSFSMDIYPAAGTHGPVFRTMGGQSSCPYEGQVVTKYYEPGTELSTATMQIEDPELICKNNMLTGVPTGGKAQFELELKNNSVTNTDCWFNLVPVDGTNPLGALLSLPTGPIGNGHAVMIPAGKTVHLILTLEQGDLSVTKYSDIQVALKSQGQDDPTSVHGEIASYVTLSAEFVPASTPVNMTIDKMVVNTSNINEKLNVKVTGFDRNFTGLTSVDLQYMAPGEQQWSLLGSYIPSESVRQNASQMDLPVNGVIELSLDMNSSTWKDGTYKFRARSYASFAGNPVTSESDIITVVKDLSRPQLYGLANPSDGVLNSGDEISLTFNEDIQKERLTDNNFVVSGVLNGAQIKHDVALSAQNTEKTAYTEATYNLANKDFSADMWVRVTGAGEIFAHGSGDNKFKVSVDADDKLVISIGDQSYNSAQSLEKNRWTFIAFSYDYEAGDSRLSARAVTDNSPTDIFSNKAVADYDGAGIISLGQNFSGAIHELTLWEKARTMSEAQADMHVTKKASTPNLIGYWKMDEGDGLIATDYARSRHMTLSHNNSWYLNNDNKAVSLDGSKSVKIDISACSPAANDSYAMEMWFKGAKADNAAASTLFYATDKSVSMGFNANGLLSMTADGQETELSNTSYLDNAWHHLALNVLRSGNATVFVDGVPVKLMSASAVPALEGSNLYIGSRAGEAAFVGSVDEIRIWNASMTGELIKSQRTQRLTGDESGLVAYYSFEQSTRDASGIISSVGSAKDLCTGTKTASMTSGDMVYTDEAPAMKVKPEATNVGYTYVANERGIVISLNEEPERLEGSTIKFTVRSVKDLNGNESSAISWTAFVQQNNLKWKDDTDIVLEKPVGETATFEAIITNESGDAENWTLSGLPTWITASATSGTLKAQLSKTITFTVDESVASGKYEQTIYLTGNKNISEPLTLNLKVKSEEPDWAVVPEDYKDNMHMVGILKVLGVPSQDEDDIVGVFIDDVCRGKANLSYVPRYDGYFFTMDIYGNAEEDNGKDMTVKVFDASEGIIYPVVTTTLDDVKFEPVFEANDFKGLYKTPVITDATDMIEQNIDLIKGWNWISFSVKPDDMNTSVVFKNAGNRIPKVVSQTNYEDYDDGWNFEMLMNNSEMYLVSSSEDFTLNVTGHRVNPQTEEISFKSGWNWISYNGQQVISLAEALGGINEPQDGDIIKGQKGVAYFDGYEWVGSLRTLAPGKGYKAKNSLENSQKVFYYPSVNSSSGARRAPMVQEAEPSVFTPVDYHAFKDNMVVIAKVVKNGEPVEGAEIGFFAGTECREAAVADNQGMVFVTVPGDKPQTISVRVSDGENIMTVPVTFRYVTDEEVGTPREPLMIELLEATGIESISASTKETIYDMAGRKIDSSMRSKLRQGVYIINGRKVTVK